MTCIMIKSACTLNRSDDYKSDLQIRDILGLKCEQVIAIIAIGDVPNGFSYARSVRLGLDKMQIESFHY